MARTPSPHTRLGLLARVVRRAAAASARRPKTAILLWMILVVGCSAGGMMTGVKSLSDADSGIGESRTADRRIESAGLSDPAVESVLIRSNDAKATATATRALEQRAAKLPEVASVAGPRETPALSKAGGRTVLVQVTLRGDPDDAKDRIASLERTVDHVRDAQPGVTLQQAGGGSADKAIDTVMEEDLKKSELISLPVTLLILVLAFGAVVAASVPLLLGLTSVVAALGALGFVSQIAPDGGSSGPLIVLIGLAVGVDYSLFYIRREREEKRAGKGADAALDATAATVGRAILVSGLTVIVALAGLLVTGLVMFQSMALATMAVVLIAVIGSLTVLPGVLSLLGHRIDKGRVPGLARLHERAGRPGHRGLWARLAGVVTRRPVAALVTSVCLLGALAVPAVQLKTADPGSAMLPKDVPAVAAQNAIERTFPGSPTSADLVVTGSGLTEREAQLQALGERARKAVGGSGAINVSIARDGHTALVQTPMPDRGADANEDAVHTLRGDVAPTVERVAPGAEMLVAGEAAGSLDFNDRLTTTTPIVIGFVLGLAFLLLLGAFRSAKLAAAVIGLNLLSVGAAYGVLVAVFQHGWAEGLLNFSSDGTVTSWIPLFLFVILFGLSMDYTVLVLERVREARMNGRSAREAAAEGIAATAGTVTSAAIVMVAVFAIFASLRMIMFKQLGVGLGAAILIDATIVRGVALPAALALLGERGWRVKAKRRADRWNDGRQVPVAALGAHDVR